MTTTTTDHPFRLPELREYERQFQAIKADAAGLVAGLDEEAFNWRPAPNRWSVAECIVHMTATGDLILPPLVRHIERARERGKVARGAFRRTLFSRVFLSFMEPPYKVKIPGPRTLLPEQQRHRLDAVDEFIALQDRIIAAMAGADGLDLGGMKMNSPFPRPVRITLAEWFLFLAAHERRHLWQAENVRREMDAPARR